MSDTESDEEHQLDKQTQLDIVTQNSMQQAFHRMELEMINIRESIGSKVDAALGNLTANKAGLDSKLDTLENLMNENMKKSEALGKAVTELSSNIKNSNTDIHIESSHVEKIAASVSSHPSLSQLSTTLTCLRSEVAQSVNLEAVQTTVEGLTDTISTLSSQVQDISKKITDTNEASSIDMAQIRKNSDNSMDLFDAMKNSLEILVKQGVTTPTPETHLPPMQTTPSLVNVVSTPNTSTEPKLDRYR